MNYTTATLVQMVKEGKTFPKSKVYMLNTTANYRSLPGCIDFTSSEYQENKANIIINRVCSYFDTSMRELKSKSRKGDLPKKRQIVMYMLREFTKLNVVKIAGIFDKHHATVLHSVKTVNDRCDVDADYRLEINKIKNRIING